MEYFNAFFEFLKTLFAALTKFLGKSIPVVSDIEGVIVEEASQAAIQP